MIIININKTNHKSTKHSVKQLLLFFIVYLIMLSFVASMRIEKNESNFMQNFIAKKIVFIENNFINKDIAKNFLLNERKINKNDKLALQNSGLMHLLAISGGQISVLIEPINFIIKPFIYQILIKITNLHKSYIYIKYLYYLLNLALACLVGYTFNWSGAIIRVISFNFSIIHIKTLMFFIINNKYTKLKFILSRIITLILIITLFGIHSISFSFLLSATGAIIAKYSLLLFNKNHPKLNFSLFFKQTIASTLLISILFLPIQKQNLINSVLANIFALPLINFIITPLSFFIIFIPQNFFYYNNLCSYFDYSLSLFKNIAYIFSFTENSSLFNFSSHSLFYLCFIIALFWSIEDYFKYKDWIKSTSINNK